MDVASFSLFQCCFMFSTLQGFQMTEIQNIYVSTGSDVKLKCPNEEVNAWQYFESKEVLALCENGTNNINPSLNVSERLNVTSDCQLLIQNFTTDDLCIYFCWERKNNSKDYKIHVQRRNLKVDGADQFGVIQGVEGTTITLRCTISGFLSGDTTNWTTNNTLLVSGKTRSLTHTFTALRSNNMKEFTCSSKNSKETKQLITHVKLNLLLKPSVLITVSTSSSIRTTEKDITVRQGQDMKLQCQNKHNKNRTGEIYAWFFNGNVFEKYTNVITFNKIKSERSGKYTCVASNKAGNDSDAVNIIVTYPPIVWTKDITFNEINRPRIIKCNVLGVPNTYNITWRHYTNNNQLVGMFNNSINGVLILPEGETNDLVFEDSGVYRCNVTNGIPDESGNVWQSEKIQVKVEGKPVLAKPLKSTFIGHFNETSSMSLFVLSSSNVTQAEWKAAENRNSLGHGCCSSTVNKTSFNGKFLDVSGYTCVFLIQNTREEDFQNYTVDLINKNGRNTFDISLISSGAPEVPSITDVYQRQNYIVLEWKPNFDGGAPQGFIVQYRKKQDEIWESIWIQSNETNDFVHISNLKPDTEYELRMLAFNRLGNSSFTVQFTTLFKGQTKDVWTQFNLFLCIPIVVPVCLFVFLLWYRKARRAVPHNSPRRNSNHAQGVVIGHDIDIFANGEDTYSSIDSRRQMLDTQQVNYKIAGKGSGEKQSDCENSNQRRNWKRKHDSTKLNYVEISFDTVTNKRQFCIHGADNRTPYADINFTAKADPMKSSDESEDSSSLNENNENDFVSLEDVQQWNIHSE